VAFQRHRIDPAAADTAPASRQPDPLGRVPRPRAEEPAAQRQPEFHGSTAPDVESHGADVPRAAAPASGAADDLPPTEANAQFQGVPAQSGPVSAESAHPAVIPSHGAWPEAATPGAPPPQAAAPADHGSSAGLPPTPPPAAAPDAAPAPERAEHRHRPWPSARQQIAGGVVVLCVGMAAFLLGHRFLPDVGGLGSLIETALPWFAVPALALLITAALVHSWRALVAAAVVVVIWAGGYGPMLLPRGAALPGNLRVVSEDLNGSPTELAAMGPLAAAQNADLVALQDLYPSMQTHAATAELNGEYRYKSTEYEFGLWSRYPISGSTPVSLGTAADTDTDADGGLAADATHVVIGALRVTLQMPGNVQVVVYVLHIPQPVVTDQGFADARDAAIARLVPIIAADHAARIIVVGNVNAAATDREFSQFTSVLGLTSAQAAAGRGFGFDWPAEFPIVRLDDVLTRGVTPVRSVVLPQIQGGQTHRPIEVDLHVAG
jgi:vancomycin resistance protein VanJ